MPSQYGSVLEPLSHAPRVQGSISGQSACLGCGLYPKWGFYRRQPIDVNFFLLPMFLYLSLLLPFSKINFKKEDNRGSLIANTS